MLVDFNEVYNKLSRDLSWRKLESLGARVPGYQQVAVRSRANGSEDSSGLKSNVRVGDGDQQGIPLSPTLFGLYIDDFEQELASHPCLICCPSRGGVFLLYADDLALVSTLTIDLRAQLDVLQAHANNGGSSMSARPRRSFSVPAYLRWIRS